MNTPTPEAHSFLQFWIIIGFIATVLVQVISIAVTFSNRKQRREISYQFEPASKTEFDQFTAITNGNFVQVRDEMKRDREAGQVHASARSATIYKKVEDVRMELDTKIEETRRELGQKIDDMPERVISTLKNTGAIG